MNDYDLNHEKILFIDNFQIGKDVIIRKEEIYKKRNKYYNVKLITNDSEIFIGKYNKTDDMFCVDYKNGKILISYKDFNMEQRQLTIVDVLSLYEILDDTFYSCTQAEALEQFDESLDCSYLRKKDSLIFRSDIEKKRRDKQKRNDFGKIN